MQDIYFLPGYFYIMVLVLLLGVSHTVFCILYFGCLDVLVCVLCMFLQVYYVYSLWQNQIWLIQVCKIAKQAYWEFNCSCFASTAAVIWREMSHWPQLLVMPHLHRLSDWSFTTPRWFYKAHRFMFILNLLSSSCVFPKMKVVVGVPRS